MQKKLYNEIRRKTPSLKKSLIGLMIAGSVVCTSLPAHAFPQGGDEDKKITINVSSMSLEQIFEQVEKQSGLEFFHNSGIIDAKKKVSVSIKDLTLKQALDKLLLPHNVTYSIVGQRIVVKQRNEKKQTDKKVNLKGTVKDSKGEGIPGVNVTIKGKDGGAVTDVNGNYSLKASAGDVLIFSFVGFTTEEATVQPGKTVFDISMKEDVEELGEVVVTALGIKREKRALGYSVTELKSNEISSSSESNVLNAMAGKVAGLDITTSTTGSMSSSRVVLRGSSSIDGNNQALIVVDGVIFDNSNYSSAGNVDRGQGISDINPDNIESVTVLKGANAAALYGSKAANGVLVITTKKKLKSQGIGLEVRSGLTLKQAYVWPELQNTYGQGKSNIGQFAGMDDDGLPYIGGGTRDESWGPKMEGQPVHVYWLRDQPVRNYTAQPDNIKEPFRTGTTYDNNVALSYATDKATYFASFMYQKVNEYLETSEGEKYGGSLRVSEQITDKLSVDMKLTYTETSAKNRITGGNSGNSFNFLTRMPRSYQDSDIRMYEYPDSGQSWPTNFKDGDPVTFATTQWIGNIYWGLYNDKNFDDRRRITGNINATYAFNKNFSAMIRYGFDASDLEAHLVYAKQSRWGNYEGKYIYQENYNKNYTTDVLLTWQDDELVDRFSFSANAGASQYKTFAKFGNFTGQGFPSKDLELINTTSQKSFSYNEVEKMINSVYGSAQAGFDNTYFLDLTYRNDWSSTLNSDNNSYGYFSTTASAIFTEPLADILPAWFDFGKVRYSYAEVGNDTRPYEINRVYGSSIGPKGETSMYNPSKLPFYNLKPERVKSHEFGIDFRLLKGRLNFDLAAYKSNTFDQIIRGQPVSETSGYGSMSLNGGNIENRGIEILVSAVPVKTEHFEWNTSVAYTRNRSEVIDLPSGLESITMSSDNFARTVLKKGSSYLTIQGRDYLRNDAGKVVVDNNGIPMATTEYVDLGTVAPDFDITWRNNFRYKNLTLGFQIDARIGGDIYSRSNIDMNEQGTSKASLEGREAWIRSEQEREAANVSSGDWIPTGGNASMIGNSVFYDASLVGDDGIQVGGVANEGANARYARPDKFWDNMSWNRQIAGPVIEDGSYVKLRELSLGYSIPKSWANRLSLQAIDFSVVGRNLLLFYKGTEHYDPDSYQYDTVSNGRRGIETGYWPSARTVSFNVKFKL
ncbi:SusC/RagA family TonB-linked outer membrane protein [Fulvitalea axinellae]|uniref:SusC/RagA family TonB-linked outer membrane protein n=1 Tax=Fulvitalea axinellae TaxID=1182444 RepID=A0AAU9DB00_9BACT|nr:SusC/RagA family TonB-linked outer membrane protein [Fulvitalea axinellae]